MHLDHTGEESSLPRRPPYRPPVGIPAPDEHKRVWTAISVAVHIAIALLLLLPVAFAPQIVNAVVDGAGGRGVLGGGGGGGGGRASTLTVERLRYVRVSPPTAAVPATPAAPRVVTTPPVAVKAPDPPPPASESPPLPGGRVGAPDSTSAGQGGGGPGSGGGLGAGVGSGSGSGVGNGTGGADGEIYPPSPTFVPLVPYPQPRAVQGHHLVVTFEVDSTGRVLSFDFNETRDAGYNRKLREVMKTVRFRPATRRDGTPVRAAAPLRYDF
ncbi:MAG: hypothetical protein NVS1B4_25400 [Gemmatimonadaceae bacterium]